MLLVLKKATADFDERRHLLGRGRCCRVFKGEVYDSIAAIKVFTDDSAFMARQRLETGDADFKAETEQRSGSFSNASDDSDDNLYDSDDDCLVRRPAGANHEEPSDADWLHREVDALLSAAPERYCCMTPERRALKPHGVHELIPGVYSPRTQEIVDDAYETAGKAEAQLRDLTMSTPGSPSFLFNTSAESEGLLEASKDDGNQAAENSPPTTPQPIRRAESLACSSIMHEEDNGNGFWLTEADNAHEAMAFIKPESPIVFSDSGSSDGEQGFAESSEEGDGASQSAQDGTFPEFEDDSDDDDEDRRNTEMGPNPTAARAAVAIKTKAGEREHEQEKEQERQEHELVVRMVVVKRLVLEILDD
eukprot:g722.t1